MNARNWCAVPRGRPADPTRARRGTGNRPTKSAAVAVQARPVDLLAPPDDLHPEAREVFDRAVAELAPRGLRPADIDALVLMAHAAHMHREARRLIAKHGTLVAAPNGRPMVNPMIKVARDEAATYLRIANEYGLTVAARLRLGLMQLAGESILASLNRDLDAAAG